MKKRKNNKTSKLDYNKIWKIWPIIAIIILLLLFALAFSVAPDWNNKKISINYNIDKIITISNYLFGFMMLEKFLPTMLN